MMRSMKYVLTLMLLLALVLPGSAGEREKALLGGLLDMGVRALGNPAQEAAPAEDAPPTAPPSRTASSSSSPMAQMIVGSLKPALDGLITEYKDEYMEQGRAYANELGHLVVTRVVQDPEINSTITSLRTLCWFVVAYLTLVTLVMLGCLLYLRRAHARLLAEVKRLARSAGQ